MTSFLWTIILSLMQGRFDSAREGGAADDKASVHFSALAQIAAGVPVRLLTSHPHRSAAALWRLVLCSGTDSHRPV